jgi:putative FmdB family regulatory protein
MPTYEYACKKCGEHLEVVQSFNDDPLTQCPACKSKNALKKVFGNVGIVFKGSGFYKTDSRSSTKSTSSSSSSSESKSETKSETKSESSSSDTKKSDTKKSEKSAAAS